MTSIDRPIPQVFALILAAGRSTRFAGDKRQALLPCGRSLLTASMEGAGKVFSSIGVVLRSDDDADALGIPPSVQVIRSEHAHLGMGHSLASGIEALMLSGFDAVAILLADMPWIQAQTLRDLAQMADPQRIALPMYDGQRGHPVIIGRAFWPALLTLEGDQGAKAVIAANAAQCDVMACDDPGTLRDVDTRAALEIAFQQSLTTPGD